ncbi:hypothetical protein EG329_010557 [Mollisiaceae sp. DMI_Dod_QoI]|nr:hypothetical protein EG329_010557 [Helotiales sp. DMI_Dod_QoI]
MDPMDYTMDDSSNAAHRYQCQQTQAQSHPQQNGPNFTPQGPSQARDGQHYDPVHESSGWYQHNTPNATHRAPFTASQNLSQWSSPAQVDPVHNWPHFAEMERAARNQDYSSSPDYRRAFMPWNESRGFEGFNHPGYNSNTVNRGNTMSENAILQSRPTTSAAPLQGYGTEPSQYLFQRDMYRGNIPPHYNALPSNASSSETRPPTDTPSSVERSIPPQPPSFSGLRAGFSRATRTSISRHEDVLEGSRRRRLASGWDSEEDEETVAELERERDEVYYRRHAAEALFGADYDEERSIAAIRGAVAGGKRVPSKEALSSLESVKVKDLTDADRTCIICYNEFGVSNPEGEIENPIRLPKCKHIFGDKCIKKWFEDSDSCPYCRDKLPSELAVRKNMAYQSYRLAHREQMRLASAQRSRYSYMPPGIPSVPVDSDNARNSAAAQRVQDEYDFMMARQADAWSYSPPNRNTTGDSPERRRQARGRHTHTAIRGPHFLGRPTSVGSARLTNPSFNHPPPRAFADYYPQPRRNAAPLTSGSEAREATERTLREARELASGSLTRASSGQSSSSESSGSAGQTPPRGTRLPTGSSVPTEEASPPVAVGSSVSARRQIDQQGSAAARLSLESNNSDFMFDLPGNTSNRQSSAQSGSVEGRGLNQNERPQGIPSFGALLEVSNNASSRFSADSSSDIEDLASIGRMDAGIPPGWGSIN